MYGGVRLWAEESRAQAVEEFRAMTVAPADQSLWSQQRVVAYAEAQTRRRRTQAVLRIPSLPLEVPVYADTSDLNLDRGAGRIPGTAGLEQSGNLGLAAHRDGFFRKLKDAELGMEISSSTADARCGTTSWRSASSRPKTVRCSRRPSRPSITLVTCYPFYFVGSAPKRYIVRAELDETQTRNEV